jgi:hypothetical protein
MNFPGNGNIHERTAASSVAGRVRLNTNISIIRKRAGNIVMSIRKETDD